MIDVEELWGSDEEELVTGRRFSSYFWRCGGRREKREREPEFHIVLVAIRRLELERLGLLPGVVGVTEVTVRGGLEVDWLLEVELLDDDSRSEIPVALDDLDELGIGLLSGSVRVDEDGQWLSDTDGVRELNENSLGETGSDEGLGDPSGSVGSRSVDLGPILSGESTTTVGTPTTVSVDNDLSSGQTSISLRTTNDESTRRLDVVNTSVIEQVLGDDLLDNLLHDLGSEVFGRDLLGVLGRDDDSVDSNGDNGTVTLLLVLDSDLGLGVGSEPSERSISSGSSHGGVELVGKHDGQRHHLGGLVGSVTEPDISDRPLLENKEILT